MSTLYILWDDSFLWGLLAHRAMESYDVPHRLVLARELPALLRIAPPSLLLVPGGNARHKAEALGSEGKQAIRDYVSSGGTYLGFCGGAGLALNWPGGLALCPWKRARFDDPLQHFMSGHVCMQLAVKNGQRTDYLLPAGMPETVNLPVWWPGRFEPAPDETVKVLATYMHPAEDFWLADLPIASLPQDIFSIWQHLYGVSITPDFLQGQPCIAHGQYGSGQYLLSYSHLETPASPQANHLLAHLLSRLAQLSPHRDTLPEWNLWTQLPEWEEPSLREMDRLFTEVVQTGIEHGLLFRRNTWLTGWRTGIAGANINNLWCAIKSIQEKKPTRKAHSYWDDSKQHILAAARLFHAGCIQYLLAERLSMTLAKTLPDTLPQGALREQREALFGPPMQAGGVYKDLIDHLDMLAYLQGEERGIPD